MHIRNGREYKLDWLVEYQDAESITKFMEGGTIIESRINRFSSPVESHNIQSIKYVFSGKEVYVPRNTVVVFPYDNPSFMFEKNGKEYVVAIDPVVTGWQLMEVVYTEES